jgi:UDP-2,4-diacetamido-2,4,6-trideoxy-beta-L-altropyranose hydrolase
LKKVTKRYKNILFRADSSSKIGLGHIMRDLVLAKQFKNAKIFFACQNLEGNIIDKIPYETIILKSKNINELIEIIDKKDIELLVIDHYEIEYKYEKEIKDKTGVKILSFDDTYKRHYCDILLNHNIYVKKKKYKDLVPPFCKIKCGKKYTLIRDEFKKVKKQKRVFVAMGGADSANLNIKILKVLSKFKDIKVYTVTTTSNQNLDKLKKYCKNKKWIELHINSNKIAKLMRKSNLAIITPSVTLNEVYFMQLPFIAIKTADNQDDMYEYLKKKKYITLKEFNKEKLLIYLKGLI